MLAAIKKYVKPLAIDIMVWGIKYQYAFRPVYVELVAGGYEPVYLKSVTHRQDPDGVRFFLRCIDHMDFDEVAAGSYQKIYVLDYQKIRREKGKDYYDRERTEDAHDPVKREPKPQKRVGLSGAPDSLRRKFNRTLDANPDEHNG